MNVKVYCKKTDLPRDELSGAAHAMLGKLIGGELPEITKNKYGKPDFVSGLHFNISHTDSYIVVAVADCEVGVDAQYIRPISDGVCLRYFGYVPDSDEEKVTQWVKYESTGKMIGCGIPIKCDIPPCRHEFFRIDNVVVCVCVSEKRQVEWITL